MEKHLYSGYTESAAQNEARTIRRVFNEDAINLYYRQTSEANADAIHAFILAAELADAFPTPEQVKANADAVCDEYERTYLNRQISMEVNHNPCPECSARHGCPSWCQVRKAYERNRPYHSDTNNSFVTRIMSAEHVDVSKYFGGIKATASKSWVERHLNDGGE